MYHMIFGYAQIFLYVQFRMKIYYNFSMKFVIGKEFIVLEHDTRKFYQIVFKKGSCQNN